MFIAEETAERIEQAKDDCNYYDMLYDFARMVSKANELSFDGSTPEFIAGKLNQSMGIFLELCMVDSGIDLDKKEEEKKDKKLKSKIREIRKVQKELREKLDEINQRQQETEEREEEERTLKGVSNFLEVSDGWGLCPSCGSKVLKVTSITVLEHFPVYCKRCRADHVVNWWNVDKLKIDYRRYVNDSHIRQQALKGTGLKNFLNTRTSATERAAMRM